MLGWVDEELQYFFINSEGEIFLIKFLILKAKIYFIRKNTKKID